MPVMQLAGQVVGRIVIYLLFPVVLTQAFSLRRRALHFVPAAGFTQGKVGLGEPLNFLAIGDSVISGVGARRIERSTVGQLVRFLSGRLSREIHWNAHGMIGAHAAKVRQRAVPQVTAAPPYEAILVSVGVNDVLKLERSAGYRRHLLDLLGDLRAHSPDAVIAYLGLPPLDEFPKLRRPLRWIVGIRVRKFDAVAREALADLPNVMHIPVTFSPRPDMFADDGLHPSEPSQRKLAKMIANRLTPLLSPGRGAVASRRVGADVDADTARVPQDD